MKTKTQIRHNQKVVCNVCDKPYIKIVTSEQAVTKSYSKTCQDCWNKTVEMLEAQ